MIDEDDVKKKTKYVISFGPIEEGCGCGSGRYSGGNGIETRNGNMINSVVDNVVDRRKAGSK